MNKQKVDIQKNSLSWERSSFKKCDNHDCNAKGEFRAPKSRIQLNDYYLFCLEHIKEYNKSWDFYKGLSVNQIENSMREDIIWNRPSWPLKGNPQKVIEQINQFFNDQEDYIDPKNNQKDFFKGKILDKNMTNEENAALRALEMNLPINLEKIKKKYKKLVKIFHPDVNGNNKIAEEKFKEINKAYRILLEKFKK